MTKLLRSCRPPGWLTALSLLLLPQMAAAQQLRPSGLVSKTSASRRLTQINSSTTGTQPQPLNTRVAVTDGLGQPVSNSTQGARPQIVAVLLDPCTNTSCPKLIGTSVVATEAGVGTFSSLSLQAKPGQYTIQFEAFGLNEPAPPINMSIIVRSCVVGEVTNDAGDECNMCGFTTFSFNPVNTSCDTCPDNGLCSLPATANGSLPHTGGAVLVPQVGYWHSSPFSAQLQACLNPFACSGNSSNRDPTVLARRVELIQYHQQLTSQLSSSVPHLNDTVLAEYQKLQCQEGYEGNLCATCASGYGRGGGPGSCVKCPAHSWNVVYYAIAWLINVVLLALTISSQLEPFEYEDETNEEVDVEAGGASLVGDPSPPPSADPPPDDAVLITIGSEVADGSAEQNGANNSTDILASLAADSAALAGSGTAVAAAGSSSISAASSTALAAIGAAAVAAIGAAAAAVAAQTQPTTRPALPAAPATSAASSNNRTLTLKTTAVQTDIDLQTSNTTTDEGQVAMGPADAGGDSSSCLQLDSSMSEEQVRLMLMLMVLPQNSPPTCDISVQVSQTLEDSSSEPHTAAAAAAQLMQSSLLLEATAGEGVHEEEERVWVRPWLVVLAGDSGTDSSGNGDRVMLLLVYSDLEEQTSEVSEESGVTHVRVIPWLLVLEGQGEGTGDDRVLLLLLYDQSGQQLQEQPLEQQVTVCGSHVRVLPWLVVLSGSTSAAGDDDGDRVMLLLVYHEDPEQPDTHSSMSAGEGGSMCSENPDSVHVLPWLMVVSDGMESSEDRVLLLLTLVQEVETGTPLNDSHQQERICSSEMLSLPVLHNQVTASMRQAVNMGEVQAAHASCVVEVLDYDQDMTLLTKAAGCTEVVVSDNKVDRHASWCVNPAFEVDAQSSVPTSSMSWSSAIDTRRAASNHSMHQTPPPPPPQAPLPPPPPPLPVQMVPAEGSSAGPMHSSSVELRTEQDDGAGASSAVSPRATAASMRSRTGQVRGRVTVQPGSVRQGRPPAGQPATTSSQTATRSRTSAASHTAAAAGTGAKAGMRTAIGSGSSHPAESSTAAAKRASLRARSGAASATASSAVATTGSGAAADPASVSSKLTKLPPSATMIRRGLVKTDGLSRGLSTHSSVIKILVNYLQVAAIVQSVSLFWPTPVKRFLDATAQLSATVGTWVSLDCSLVPYKLLTKSVQTVLITVFMPFAILLLALPVWVVIWVFTHNQFKTSSKDIHKDLAKLGGYLSNRMTITWVSVLFCFYPNITTQLVSIFSCMQLDDSHGLYNEFVQSTGKWWANDLSLQCYTGPHLTLMLTLGIPGTLLFGIGVPVGFATFLYRRRHKLHEELFASKYGFIYADYEDRCLYWESVVMLRKFLLVVLVTTAINTSTQLQLLLALGIIILAMVAAVMAKPYRLNRLDFLDRVSHWGNTLIVYLALYFFAPDTSGPGKEAVTFFLVFCSTGIIAYLGIQIAREFLWTTMRELDTDNDGLLSRWDIKQQKERAQQAHSTLATLMVNCVSTVLEWSGKKQGIIRWFLSYLIMFPCEHLKEGQHLKADKLAAKGT